VKDPCSLEAPPEITEADVNDTLEAMVDHYRVVLTFACSRKEHLLVGADTIQRDQEIAVIKKQLEGMQNGMPGARSCIRHAILHALQLFLNYFLITSISRSLCVVHISTDHQMILMAACECQHYSIVVRHGFESAVDIRLSNLWRSLQ